MVIFVVVKDVVTGIMGKDLVINDVVYNSFLFTTLGSFGIINCRESIRNNKNKINSFLRKL